MAVPPCKSVNLHVCLSVCYCSPQCLTKLHTTQITQQNRHQAAILPHLCHHPRYRLPRLPTHPLSPTSPLPNAAHLPPTSCPPVRRPSHPQSSQTHPVRPSHPQSNEAHRRGPSSPQHPPQMSFSCSLCGPGRGMATQPQACFSAGTPLRPAPASPSPTWPVGCVTSCTPPPTTTFTTTLTNFYRILPIVRRPSSCRPTVARAPTVRLCCLAHLCVFFQASTTLATSFSWTFPTLGQTASVVAPCALGTPTHFPTFLTTVPTRCRRVWAVHCQVRVCYCLLLFVIPPLPRKPAPGGHQATGQVEAARQPACKRSTACCQGQSAGQDGLMVLESTSRVSGGSVVGI